MDADDMLTFLADTRSWTEC